MTDIEGNILILVEWMVDLCSYILFILVKEIIDFKNWKISKNFECNEDWKKGGKNRFDKNALFKYN